MKYTLGDDGFYTLEDRQKNFSAFINNTFDKTAVDFERKSIKIEVEAEIVEKKIYQCKYCKQMYK